MIEEDDDEMNVCDKSWGYFAKKKKKSVSDRNGAKVEPGELWLTTKRFNFPYSIRMVTRMRKVNVYARADCTSTAGQ